MKLIGVVTNPSEVGTILRHLIKTGRAPAGPGLPRIEIRALAMRRVADRDQREGQGRDWKCFLRGSPSDPWIQLSWSLVTTGNSYRALHFELDPVPPALPRYDARSGASSGPCAGSHHQR